jgi:hypothetical protein
MVLILYISFLALMKTEVGICYCVALRESEAVLTNE